MADKTVTSNIITDLISGAQNVIGGDKLQVGTIPQFGVGKIAPTSPEAAITTGLQEAVKAPGQALEGIKEQAKIISEDEQKLIDLVSSRMGLSSQSPSPGAKSPAQIKAEQLINSFNMAPPVVVDLINSTYGTWSGKGFTFDRFLDLLFKAKQVFQDPQGIKQFVNKLADAMVDAMPLYTPNQMLDIALSGLANKNLNDFNTIILILPFYKSIIENKPVDMSLANKGLEASTLLNSLSSDPAADTKAVRENLFNKNKMLQSIWPFYRGVLMWTTKMNSAVLADIANKMKNRRFQTGTLFEMLVNMEMYKQELAKTVSQGISGKEVFNTKTSSSKIKKYRIITSQAAVPSGTSTPASQNMGNASLSTPSPATAPNASTGAGATTSTTTSTANQQEPLDAQNERSSAISQIINQELLVVQRLADEKKQLEGKLISLLEQIFNTSTDEPQKISSSIGHLYNGKVYADQIERLSGLMYTSIQDIFKYQQEALSHINKVVGVTAKNQAQGIQKSIEFAASDTRVKLFELYESYNSVQQFNIVLPEAQFFIDKIASYNMSKAQFDSPMNFLTTTVVKFDTLTKPGTAKYMPVEGVTKSRARAEIYKMGLECVSLMHSAASKLTGGNNAFGLAMAQMSQNLMKKAEIFDLANKAWFMQKLKQGIRPISTSPGRSK